MAIEYLLVYNSPAIHKSLTPFRMTYTPQSQHGKK